MTYELHSSRIRLISGFILIIVGLLTVITTILLKKSYRHKYISKASNVLDDKISDLNSIITSKQLLDQLSIVLPINDISKIQGNLSKILFSLARQNNIHTLKIKYTPLTKQVVNTDFIGSTYIDFDLISTYSQIRTFMKSLEQSSTNFVVTEAQLEECQDGAHLTVRLLVIFGI